MPRRTAFDRLITNLSKPPHDYHRSLEVFPSLDVDKIAEELDLETHGNERAAEKPRGRASTVPDDIELKIQERVESEKKGAYTVLEDELQTYTKRLSGLDIVGRFSEIQRAAPSCITEFTAEVATGRDELHGLRRNLVEIENELENFRKDHGLKRTARSHSSGMTFLKWAFLGFLWVFESALNGSFLAKGSDQGLVGGISEAIGFASLNVFGALIFATIGARQMYHQSVVRKVIGFISIIAWIIVTLVLNLALAHYREVAGTLADQGGQQVIGRLLQSPFELADINSWVLFGVGLIFAIGAFIDGLMLFDPYPGYGALQKRVDRARDAYATRKAELVEELRAVCEDYGTIMDELSRDLGVRRGEYDDIIAQRGRLVGLFNSHQAHLESSGNALLAVYCRAKGSSGSRKPFKLQRIEVSANQPEESDREEMKATIKSAQKVLKEQNEQIHQEFDKALKQYRQIDDLFPGGSDGPSTA